MSVDSEAHVADGITYAAVSAGKMLWKALAIHSESGPGIPANH
jgi:hypothetical protein